MNDKTVDRSIDCNADNNEALASINNRIIHTFCFSGKRNESTLSEDGAFSVEEQSFSIHPMSPGCVDLNTIAAEANISNKTSPSFSENEDTTYRSLLYNKITAPIAAIPISMDDVDNSVIREEKEDTDVCSIDVVSDCSCDDEDFSYTPMIVSGVVLFIVCCFIYAKNSFKHKSKGIVRHKLKVRRV